MMQGLSLGCWVLIVHGYLDPGNYTFQVAVFDPNDTSNASMREVSIVIKKPFWRTPLAYVIYALVIVISLYLINDFIISRERFNAKIEKERMEARQIHELDLMKIKFFTNISHEFRTPLTLILTPVERLLKQFTGTSEEKHLEVAHRNAKRLLTLVNQLLDFRKMEAGQHKLSLSSGDIVLFTKNILGFFTDVSEDRRINLSFETEIDRFLTYFDGDKMEKVLFNLLSNAFKFTNENGHVRVYLKELRHDSDKSVIQIKVADTGIGIPEKKQKKIFKRFFQVESGDSTATINHGSGIGLSITKEFVEMHQGTIKVTSKEGEGSVFTVELPLQRIEHLGETKDPVMHDLSLDNTFSSDKATVMIVEDNNDFRFYLHDNLREHYNILEACNGKKAWAMIVKSRPDIVVSDIMMPEMDGIALCRKIKHDPRVAHIPVILLTSLYSDDQKLEGYEVGASEYITKPFNFEILLRSIASTVPLIVSPLSDETAPVRSLFFIEPYPTTTISSNCSTSISRLTFITA
jgi:signal transduction histidine kinase/ActR/RegA family two-component response regulator